MAVNVESTTRMNVESSTCVSGRLCLIGFGTKDCFVVLQRLDEKWLERYLRKDSKRKRRKVRRLCYTDDEADPVETKPSKTCSKNDRSAQVDSQAMKDTEQEPKEMGCELVETVEGRKEELPVANSSSPSARAGCCSAVDNEIEIINEFPKSFGGNVICDKTICDAKFITQDESGYTELNDLDDSREEGEDDRSTVIFEKDTDLEEVFELEEKEIGNNFKKKKMMIRKKQRLVKFKRKSMTGRNLGKIRKSKSKLFESGSGGQDTAEKSLSDCIAEDSLREVCISVRRLHDMYTVILQLQKEMPKDTELSYHFKRVINAQRENFHREIRKSQKIIIKSFEKLLKPSTNTLDKVALDIGRKTFLTSEEVIYVLSLCILSEGSCDVDKIRSGSVEKTEQPKSSSSSLHKQRITKKATQGISSNSKVQPQEVVNTQVPSVAPPLRAPVLPVAVTAHPVQQRSAQSHAPISSVPDSTGQVPKAGPQPCDYYQAEKSNQRSNFWAQQNFESTRVNSGARQFREMSLPQVVRQSAPSTQLPSTMSQYCNARYTNHNAVYPPGPRPPTNCSLYASTGHYRRGDNLPSVQGRTPGLPLLLPSQRQCNYVPDKPNANQTFGSPVLVQNTLGYGAVGNRISENNQPVTLNTVPTATQRTGAFPNLENRLCNMGNGAIILTPTGESQCHPDFTHSVGYYNAAAGKSLLERLTVPVEVGYSGAETNSTEKPDSEVSEVLDPTIPQKLTMKNCRLQAGPILGTVKPPEERTKCDALEKTDQEHSRSRTYICAEDGCKNPGVRICNFCQSVIYCSKTCQRKHWDLKHKAECCQLKELRG